MYKHDSSWWLTAHWGRARADRTWLHVPRGPWTIRINAVVAFPSVICARSLKYFTKRRSSRKLARAKQDGHAPAVLRLRNACSQRDAKINDLENQADDPT